MNIAIIVGTTRKKRASYNVARLIETVGNEIEGVETLFIDPLDFELPFDGNEEYAQDPDYEELTKKADAFFLVVPEYNHSFPSSLKRILDSEGDFSHYIHKPVAMAGVSAGPWGGVRAIESLVNVVRELGLVVTSKDVNFPFVKRLFSEEGELLDDKFIRRIRASYQELIWMTETLRYGRENINKSDL